MALPKRTRIDELLEAQGSALAHLSNEGSARVLRALEDSRRLLLERLQAIPSAAEAHRLRLSLIQAEAGIADLRYRLGLAFDANEAAVHQKVMTDLIALVRQADPQFQFAGTSTQADIVERLSRQSTLLLHRYSVGRYSAQVMDAIQRAMVSGIAAGLDQPTIATRIAGAAGSVVANHRGRADLIARMEIGRAYNEASLEGMKSLDAADPRGEDPVLKMIDEYTDSRNHPFSRVANRQTQPIADPFRVDVGAVASMANAMRKSTRGVIWPIVRGFYTGHNLPAHFNDRGRIVPWRMSWGAP